MINPHGGEERETDYVRRGIGEQHGAAVDAMFDALMIGPWRWHPGWRLVGLASIASGLPVPICWSILLDAVDRRVTGWRAIERQDRAVCRRHDDCPLVRDGSHYRIRPGERPGRARADLHG